MSTTDESQQVRKVVSVEMGPIQKNVLTTPKKHYPSFQHKLHEKFHFAFVAPSVSQHQLIFQHTLLCFR